MSYFPEAPFSQNMPASVATHHPPKSLSRILKPGRKELKQFFLGQKELEWGFQVSSVPKYHQILTISESQMQEVVLKISKKNWISSASASELPILKVATRPTSVYFGSTSLKRQNGKNFSSVLKFFVLIFLNFSKCALLYTSWKRWKINRFHHNPYYRKCNQHWPSHILLIQLHVTMSGTIEIWRWIALPVHRTCFCNEFKNFIQIVSPLKRLGK